MINIIEMKMSMQYIMEKIKTTLSYLLMRHLDNQNNTGLRRAVGNVSGNRCKSDCRSRGHKFDLGPVPYFPGD